MSWTARSIPDQSGRTAVVTGANSGIGYVTARELARRGARVVLACRSEQRGAAALDRLLSQVPEAQAELRLLDLADLASVQGFAEALPYERIDLLINNAGVMAVPYARTADGVETQFGVNHLGHFALTGLLLERLLAAPGARVVTVSSMAHALSNIDINDLSSERRYRPMLAYAASKTANLLFVRELAHRAAHKGVDLTVAAAHPGYAATELQVRGPQLAGSALYERLARLSNRVFAASPDQGAAPSLYAATAPYVHGDSFFGPRILGVRGGPGMSWRASWARNDIAAGQLWAASERLTGVTYRGL
ncbi:NADP-dependent 3-hydroxy acid dehydrogenase YdfG [Streptomyces sp. WMMB 714]|uniref:oxidoreductase n=1 Tax=Streptomyces sp. WMMB 714 TaxID=1286822 RepID=UPI0005F864BC|nr:oxidoreductase [Streptomyces sp. WMMB 714]SCK18856.1 NADP-dependent 3-hydroxy acid dehydrogenase YdfG [Streptomyces sp. WMMB 714]